jgi:hypothetical protein
MKGIHPMSNKDQTQTRLEGSLSWQITPRALMAAFTDTDRAAAKRAFDAMMQMRKIDIAAIEAARRG